jgi:RNA polymerase sigma factor (sigma-70 family)
VSRPARRTGGGPGDADLLFRVRAGDQAAFDELYDRFSRPALALARRILSDDAAAAEDVLREVLLGVWRDPGAYDRGSGSVTSWVMERVHLRAVEAVRRGQAHRRRPAGRPADQERAGEVPDPVRAALRSLPDAECQALTLAYYGGYTQREVAALTGTPLTEVKVAVLAAVRALQCELGTAAQGGALGSPAVVEGPGR